MQEEKCYTCFLAKLSDSDKTALDCVDQSISSTSRLLDLMEKRYRIKDFKQSRKLYKFPKRQRIKAAALWKKFETEVDQLYYTFLGEDLYI